MADFNIRSDSVDVEQIMRQIRARIREKRGVDYTEAEVQQLAKVKLEKFLDPSGVRSDLIEQFRRRDYTPSPPLRKLDVEPISIFDTHRGFLRTIRKMLQPILKLFMNPNALVHYVWKQSETQAAINGEIEQWMRRRETKVDPLYFELLHNLVVELTRAGIEVHNLKMRVESLSSRLDFDERRGRALERVVEYRPGAVQRGAQAGAQAASGSAAPTAATQPPGGPAAEPRSDGTGGERRRRRRRRRRRPGQNLADRVGGAGPANGAAPEAAGRQEAPRPQEVEETSETDADDFEDEASDQ